MIGLTSEEAKKRQAAGQGNVSHEQTSKTIGEIVRENVFTYFNFIFFVLAILIILARAWNSLSFLVVIIINTLIGIAQEVYAKKVLDNLNILNAPTAMVYRDGSLKQLAVSELVLGDVIALKGGDQIPADARVINGSVNVNEALLTGEADEIEKTVDSALMSGSFIVNGECEAELTHVGDDSYISQLTAKAKKVNNKESDMVKAIDRIVKFAGVAIIPIGLMLFGQSYLFAHKPFSESVVSSVAAVIGMIPEGLYLLVSVRLALSAVMLARQQVMLHNMKSIEALARVDTLCVDKTGTITDHSMLVADFMNATDMNASLESENRDILQSYVKTLPDDNATMQAIRSYIGESDTYTSQDYMSFSSKYKYSAVTFGHVTYMMGAPEIVLAMNYETYREQIESFASKGLRVLVFASKEGGLPAGSLSNEYVEPIFYIMLSNPLRKNAKETFSYFKKQGVDVKVISGDNPVTVSEVAKQAGILHAENHINAQTLGDEKAIAEAVQKYTVFGRVTPEQKQMIVRALKKQGHTVAMTGDGVNDILAMKDADCSIGMAAGSDAAVQAAQLVLLDSDFSHMPAIVSQGRNVVNNIERSATLFLVKNIFSLILAIFTIVNFLTYPLSPAQISLISFFTIGCPAFLLALEPSEERITGHFIRRVLFKSLPAAITDFAIVGSLVVFGETFGVATKDISVASAFLMSIVGFLILISISKPLNLFKSLVIGGNIIGILAAVYFGHRLFDITRVSQKCIMLFVVFAIASEPVLRYLTIAFEAVANAKEWLVRKFTRKKS
ncbi:MAG: HAD-IC family P-type ATPase [Intestinibaculum porci]|uniref:cation-translocating P-type ATPase n=1 Tax=Intestinibaculum porci TaxID=2487118 RepID=UPI003F11BEAC